MFDVAIAFPNNPKEEDDKIKEADTDPFQVKSDLLNVLELSFCPWKSIEEVSNLFLSLCFGRLWFSYEVDDLKKAQGSEEVRQKKCVKLLSWFLWWETARFRDSLR